MSTKLSERSRSGAGLLAVALTFLSLGAPWFVAAVECRGPGCAQGGAPALPAVVFAAPAAPPCPCPASCETDPAQRCSRGCSPVRESIFKKQSGPVRPGSTERLTLALAVEDPPDASFASRTPRHNAARRASVPLPLFIRHQSILR